MDITSIIITVALCIGALVVLYFLLAGIIFLIGARQARKITHDFQKDFNKGFDSDFFKRNRR